MKDDVIAGSMTDVLREMANTLDEEYKFVGKMSDLLREVYKRLPEWAGGNPHAEAWRQKVAKALEGLDL